MPRDRDNLAVVASLNAMSSGELTIRFVNWLDRLIHPHPRQVFLSREITSNPRYNKHIADVAMLMLMVERGDELTPHLSRSIRHGYELPRLKGKNLNRRKDLDMMLNDWGVHHLHLSADVEGDSFVRRNDILLFAIFTDTAAFFLDLCRHGEWTNQHIVEVAVRNWPDQELFYKLEGVVAGGGYTAEQHKTLRGAGITAMIQVDGVAYMSRSAGINTVGNSGRSMMKAMRLNRELREVERRLRDDPHYFRADIERMGKVYPDQPEFRVELFRGGIGFGFGIREVKSQAIFPIHW